MEDIDAEIHQVLPFNGLPGGVTSARAPGPVVRGRPRRGACHPGGVTRRTRRHAGRGPCGLHRAQRAVGDGIFALIESCGSGLWGMRLSLTA